MAPSQQQDMETLEYTHKKFNCGYSHKKLGMRLIRRNSQEEREMMEQHQAFQSPTKTNNSNKSSLFRPYDLDNKNAPKPTSAFSVTQENPSQTFNQDPQHYIQFVAMQQFAQQSQEQYALKLQRQRAALYMKHVMQFYENGNGWPSVHPNAINNPGLYKC